MRLLYLTHDVNDPTTAKRVAMLVAGGASVQVAGFRRGAARANVVDFGETHNGRFLQRIGMVLRQVMGVKKQQTLFADVDVILARNLETLAIAVRMRRLSKKKPTLVYECLDIHRLLLREDAIAFTLRKLEGWLSRRASLLVTSSPAFTREYFEKRSSVKLPTLLVENKVFSVDEPLRAPARPAGPPWRIGWFGAIRCHQSLDILCKVARANPGLVEIIIRGRPAYDQFADFDAQVKATPGVTFHGAYTPGELPALYGEVHFSWAIDMFEEGLNSSWLLPNRLYEGGLYDAVPLAAHDVETSRFIEQLGIGFTLGEPKAEALSSFLRELTPEQYEILYRSSARVPRTAWRIGQAECAALVSALQAPVTETSTPTPQPLPPVTGNAPVLVVIPCLNEAKTIEGLVNYLSTEAEGCPMRIVIADGGSTDGTVVIASRLAQTLASVEYLHNPKRIQSAAINLAVEKFGDEHDYLIRIDAHAHYPAGYCRALLEEARASQAESVVVAMRTVGHQGFQQAAAAAQNSKLGNGGSSHRLAGGEGKWVDHGHHALMRIAAYRAVGGYDESFSHNEDAELDTRLRKAGYRIWLTGRTTLDYFPRSSPLALFRQYRQYGRGRLRNLLKHRERPKLRQMLPVAVVPAALLLILSPFIGVAALPFFGWAAICLGYGALLAYRAKDPNLMMSGPAAMLMHGGWSLGFWQGLVDAATARRA